MSFNRGQDYRKYAHNYGNRNNNNNRDGWGRNNSNHGGGQHRNNSNYGGDRRGNHYERPSFTGDNINSSYSRSGGQNRHNEHRPCDNSYAGVDSKRAVPPAAAAAAAVAAGGPSSGHHQSGSYSSKKHKSHETYFGEDLSPEQMQYREKVESQLPEGERIEWISKQAFLLEPGWDALMEKAAQYAIEGVEKELKKAQDSKVPSHSDYESSDSDISVIGNKQKPGTLSPLQRKYFYKLPECHLLRIGFHIEIGDNKHCLCPCCKQNAKWRKQNELDLLIDNDIICHKFTICEPLGIMSHLRKMGGMYEEKKDRKLNKIPMQCIYHYGARLFMEYLYKDYNGEGIGHKALYQLNDENYRKAERAAERRKEKENRMLKRENIQLKEEAKTNEQKMLELQISHQDLYNKYLRLQSEKTKLGVESKETTKMTEEDLERWRGSILGQFDAWCYVVDNGKELGPVAESLIISVEPDPEGKCSYRLNPLLNDIYDRNRKPSIWKLADFNRCRKVFFDDMPTPDEIAALKEKKKHTKLTKVEMIDITIALMSKFDVQFNKTEAYARGAKEQKAKDTAIDQGGPSMQFFSDAWKQMQCLAVPVLSGNVQIFNQATAGEKRENVLELIPIQDDVLIYDIKRIAANAGIDAGEMEDLVEHTKTRIYCYARVMGRFLLHSFARGYPVSSAVMTPFYMNLLLRGITSGDPRYEQCDIIDHLDGILCSDGNKLLSDWLNEQRDDGTKWDKEAIFSHRIYDEFVESRSLVLGGIMDGLSIRGRRDASRNLKNGSELCNVLHSVPLEAISKILFARPVLTFEDVSDVLHPEYCKFVDWEGNDNDLANYIAEQEKFYKEQFLPYVKDEAERDNKFLSKFVECCTGSCCLPYVAPGSNAFKIEVEFNLDEKDPLALPRFHTCTKQLVLPGHVYIRGTDDFRIMMNEALENCWNKFDMQ